MIFLNKNDHKIGSVVHVLIWKYFVVDDVANLSSYPLKNSICVAKTSVSVCARQGFPSLRHPMQGSMGFQKS